MNIIVAVNSDWGIGFGGAQQIVIPEDRRRFRELTSGGAIITGKRTFDDFRKPLPDRMNIILTRDMAFSAEGIIAAHSVEEAILHVSGYDTERVFIVGGGCVYKLFLPLCAYAYVTKIEAAPLSDTFFPNLDEMPEWMCISRKYGMRNTESDIGYSFDIYKNMTLLRSK